MDKPIDRPEGAPLVARCELCGEPMPENESMFKYHGFSGNCPKPPLSKPKANVVVEYRHYENDDGLWIGVNVDRQPYDKLGPFSTEGERTAAIVDMLDMVRSLGGKDLPKRVQ